MGKVTATIDDDLDEQLDEIKENVSEDVGDDVSKAELVRNALSAYEEADTEDVKDMFEGDGEIQLQTNGNIEADTDGGQSGFSNEMGMEVPPERREESTEESDSDHDQESDPDSEDDSPVGSGTSEKDKTSPRSVRESGSENRTRVSTIRVPLTDEGDIDEEEFVEEIEYQLGVELSVRGPFGAPIPRASISVTNPE